MRSKCRICVHRSPAPQKLFQHAARIVLQCRRGESKVCANTTRKHHARGQRPPRIPHFPPRAAPVTGGGRAFLSVSGLSPRWLSALGTAAPSPEQRPIWFRGARFQKCLQTPSLSACSFAAKLATTRWRRCSCSFSSMYIICCCGFVGSATLVS